MTSKEKQLLIKFYRGLKCLSADTLMILEKGLKEPINDNEMAL